MRFGALLSDTALFGVLPILPAASSLFAVVVAGLCGLVAAIAALRLSSVRSLIRAVWRQKWGLLSLGCVVLLGLKAAALTRPINRPAVVSPMRASPWPMYRGTLSRTGHADGRPGPLRGGIQWSAGRGFDFISSPAVVGDWIIAVGSQGNTARFFCWDAASGDQVWSIAPAGYRSTFSSPVFHNGYLFCGEGLHQTTDARLLALNLGDGLSAQAAGQLTTRSHVECTPVIADERIYFGAGDDGIYCLELPTDKSSGLRIVWHLPGDKYPDAETALTVHKGRVYVGLGFGGEALCVLDAATGNELARIKLSQPLFSPPAIDGDRIYVGLGRADYVNYRNSPPGEVRCIDLNTLETIWTVPTPAAVLTAIVVHKQKTIFSTVDGELFVADQHGQINERWHARAPVLTAPAVTDRMIYCVAGDGLLTGLNHRLERVWNVRLGAPGDYISSPIVFKGHVYAGTPADGLICVGDAVEDAASELTDHDQTPNAIIPAEVEVAWTLAGPSPDIRADVTAPPAVTPTDLVAPMAGDTWSGLSCFDLTESSPPRSRWTQQIPERIESSPIIRGDCVVCLCGRGGEPGRLIGLERNAGRIIWNHSVSRVSSSLSVDGYSAYVQSEPGRLTRWSLRGERLWHIQVGKLDHPIAVQGEIAIAATRTPRQLMALDRISGSTLWQIPLSAKPTSSPMIVRTEVFVPTTESIEVHSLVDGALLHKLENGSQTASLFVDRDRVVATTSSGELLVGATGSRTALRRWSGTSPKITPLVGINAIVFASGTQGLIRLTVDDAGPPQPWFVPGDNKQINLSPVACDERVYVPVAGIGLVCLNARSKP